MTIEAEFTRRSGEAGDRRSVGERVGGALVWVELDERCRFSFRGENEEHVEVRANGDLYVQRPVGADATVVLRFELAGGGAGERFVGIQLGRSENDWDLRPTTLDTEGAYYRDEHDAELPFKVAPSAETEPLRALVLTQFGDLEPLAATFHYRIHVHCGGSVHTHDPKIYNEGGPGGG